MATITSSASGLWSATSTWVGGVVPVEGDKVNIAAGHTVTLNGTYVAGDDTTTAINVTGILKASRTVSSRLTVKGSLTQARGAQHATEGALDFGTAADPIPAGVTAELVLNYSAAMAVNKYPLTWTQLCRIDMNGAAKSPWSRLNGAVTAGSTSFTIDDAAGWAVGDKVILADTGAGTAYQGDVRTISGMVGNVITVPAVTFAHADRAVVGNFTRNVRVRPHSATFPCQFRLNLGGFAQDAVVTGGPTKYTFGYVEFNDLGAAATLAAGVVLDTRDYSTLTGPLATLNGATFHVTDPTNASGAAIGNLMLFNQVGVWQPVPITNVLIGARNSSNQSGMYGLRVDSSAATITDTWALSGGSAISIMNSVGAPVTLTRSGWAVGAGQPYWQKDVSVTATDCDFGACNNFFFEGAVGDVEIVASRIGTGAGNGSIGTTPWIGLGQTGIGINGLRFTDCQFPLSTYTEAQIAGQQSSVSVGWWNGLPNSQIDFIRPNGDDRVERKRRNGVLHSDASTHYRSDRAIRFALSANNGADGCFCDFEYPVVAGTAYTFRGYLRKNSAYGASNRPSVTLSGQGGAASTFTMTDTVDTWEQFTLSITPTSTGSVVLKVRGYYAASGATFYLDGVTTSPFSSASRHYGYVFDGNAHVTADPYITQANEATVGAYTGIAINHGTGTITLTSAHSIQEVYDYCYWDLCQTANLSRAEFFTTANGANYTSSYELILNGGSLTGSGTLSLGSRTLTRVGAETSTVPISYSSGTGFFTNATVSGLVVGSRVRLYDSTAGVELLNAVAGASTVSVPVTWTGVDHALSLRVAYASGTTAYLPFSAVGSISNGTAPAFTVSQAVDTVYAAIGVDGSTCTEFTADYPNLQIDISDADHITTVQRIYSWSAWAQTTASGIALMFKAVTALDTSNFIIDVGVVNARLDNVTGAPVIIGGGYLSRSDATTVIAPASGSIQMDPGKAYVAPNSTAAVWTSEIEPGFSAARMLRTTAAAVAGATSGGPSLFTARNLSNTADQIVGTATPNGDRNPTNYGA